MNTSLGDNLVGVTDQLFKMIPYNVTRIDFSKVNFSCCKSLPPNLKSQIKIKSTLLNFPWFPSTYLVVRYKNGGHTIQNMAMKIHDHNCKGSV